MRKVLASSLGLVAGLLAAPLLAQAGPTTCPANGLCVDESVEGQLPTLTAPAGIDPSVVPLLFVTVGEAWRVTFIFPTTSITSSSTQTFGLLEPGSQLLSDAIPGVIVGDIGSGQEGITFQLLSDNDLGQIATSSFSPCCATLATEDGTFQFTGNSVTFGGTTYSVYLRSDVEPIPEPASLVLFGTALAGFGMMRRRHGVRRRGL